MTRLALAICLILGSMTLCSCGEPNEGVQKPDTVTPPPERITSPALPPGAGDQPENVQ